VASSSERSAAALCPFSSIYLCTFDLWLVLVNLLAAAVFIKFMVAIKHAVFISSLILFALAYLLLFLHDLLYTMAVILLYLLFSINAIGQLAAMKAEATPGNLTGTNQLALFALKKKSILFMPCSLLHAAALMQPRSAPALAP